jgi:hypothetical protein
MELFLRIQQKDSGVPSAVESIEHPGEPSYLLNQPTGLTPPTPESCRLYAAAAARVGIALEKYDRKRPPAYRESALRAMSWVESNPGAPDIYGFDASQLGESANLAAVWMYRLTGEAKWHAEAIRTFRLVHGDEGKVRLDRTRYSQGLWVLFPEAPAGPSLRARAAPRRIGANLWLTNRGGKTCQDGAWRAFGVSLRSLMRRGPRNSAGSSILTRPSVGRS